MFVRNNLPAESARSAALAPHETVVAAVLLALVFFGLVEVGVHGILLGGFSSGLVLFSYRLVRGSKKGDDLVPPILSKQALKHDSTRHLEVYYENGPFPTRCALEFG